MSKMIYVYEKRPMKRIHTNLMTYLRSKQPPTAAPRLPRAELCVCVCVCVCVYKCERESFSTR